jgi:hypothetical protein
VYQETVHGSERENERVSKSWSNLILRRHVWDLDVLGKLLNLYFYWAGQRCDR